MPALHISPQGSDKNPGTAELPLQSLAAAKARVKEIAASSVEGEAEEITLQLSGGIHRLSETLVIRPEDVGHEGFQVNPLPLEKMFAGKRKVLS